MPFDAIIPLVLLFIIKIICKNFEPLLQLDYVGSNLLRQKKTMQPNIPLKNGRKKSQFDQNHAFKYESYYPQGGWLLAYGLFFTDSTLC